MASALESQNHLAGTCDTRFLNHWAWLGLLRRQLVTDIVERPTIQDGDELSVSFDDDCRVVSALFASIKENSLRNVWMKQRPKADRGENHRIFRARLHLKGKLLPPPSKGDQPLRSLPVVPVDPFRLVVGTHLIFEQRAGQSACQATEMIFDAVDPYRH